MVAKIFIDGEAGTTGLQIRERLAGRRDLEVLSIAADKRKDQAERKRLLNAADVAILCLPDDAAKESVALIENGTTRVIDASTAHRIADGWTYGFAEMDKAQAGKIAAAKRVGNPGCWPQGAIATLRPLIEAGLIPADFPLTVHGISGYTGGGRSMIEDYVGKGEDAKVSVRNVRRRAMEELHRIRKDGEAGEDEVGRAEKDLDKSTATYVGQIDELVKHKEGELLEV